VSKKLEYSDVLKQLDLSGQWPLAAISKAASRWYMVGRSNYSLIDNKLVDGLVGFEYKADCWSLRMVAQRYATSATTTTKSFSIQLELNGLSRGFGAGTNPIEILKRNISGYQSGR